MMFTDSACKKVFIASSVASLPALLVMLMFLGALGNVVRCITVSSSSPSAKTR